MMRDGPERAVQGTRAMGPMIADDDSSDDEVPLAQRMKQEAAAPKGPKGPKAAAVKKPASKGKIKMSGAKKKEKPKKKKKKKPAKKAPSGPVREKKVYDLPGQKRDTPEEGDSLRKFYLSLRVQIPESVMAEQWLMEHGLLPADEAAKAYKKFLKRKGRDPNKAGGSSDSKPSASKPKPKPKPKPAVKKEHKPPVVKKASGIKRKALDDDDSDSDIPLAALKSNGGGGGFKIPKKE